MTKKKLHPKTKAVVHQSKHRTRLRVPKKYRQHDHLHSVRKKIEDVPGVKSVEVNPETGSVLIHHDELPHLLDDITSALEESAPELLACMLFPGAEEGELGLEMIGSLCKRWFTEPANGRARGAASEAAAGSEVATGGGGRVAIKGWVPIAFIAAGAWQLWKEEALLTGIAPIALFYYGFDMYWKMHQEALARQIEQATAAASPAAPQPVKEIHRA